MWWVLLVLPGVGAACSSGAYATSSTSTTCLNCAVGMYSTAIGAVGFSCIPSPQGTYTSAAGSTAPTLCAAGTYSPITQANTACTSCSKGTYSSALGASSYTTCMACPVGSTTLAIGQTSSSACSACAAGTKATTTCVPAPLSSTWLHYNGPGMWYLNLPSVQSSYFTTYSLNTSNTKVRFFTKLATSSTSLALSVSSCQYALATSAPTCNGVNNNPSGCTLDTTFQYCIGGCMEYGAPGSCNQQVGSATVDLIGTPFTVASQLQAWWTGSFCTQLSTQPTVACASTQKCSISLAANCAGILFDGRLGLYNATQYKADVSQACLNYPSDAGLTCTGSETGESMCASTCGVCPAGTYSAAGDTACTACSAGTYAYGGASSCFTCQLVTPTVVDNGASSQPLQVTNDASRRFFKFTSTSGTNTFSFPVDTTAQVLVVGGGGSGGTRNSGGGGAGGLVYNQAYTFAANVLYTVVVGAGGASVTGNSISQGTNGNSGGNSYISAAGNGNIFSAIGGGNGGQPGGAATGGSTGGGFNANAVAVSTANINASVSPYTAGNVGGNPNGIGQNAGGGGGAGSTGFQGSGSNGGNGGLGVAVNVTGVSTVYAAGGGGGAPAGATAGAGGSSGVGGAGAVGTATALDGVPNTGSGGGGGGYNGGTSGNSGAGGSGVVVISWQACNTCPPGTYLTNQQCVQCPASTFSNVASSTSCTPCALGSYSKAGASVCTTCSAGTTNVSAAVGGNVTLDVIGSYVHAFTTSGNITFPQDTYVDVLVGGGGGGGGANVGGGGGAGAIVYYPQYLFRAGTYSVTVAASAAPATQGATSSIAQGSTFIFSAVGGGYGGGFSAQATPSVGGSGGGAADSQAGSITVSGAAFASTNVVALMTGQSPANSIYVKGNAGGTTVTTGTYCNNPPQACGAGGGGGAGASPGTKTAASCVAQSGGAGINGTNGYLFSTVFGIAYSSIVGGSYIGGGGGGGGHSSGACTGSIAGGIGGGGIGAMIDNTNGGAASPNTCGGGGGSSSSSLPGGAGASGLVLLRYSMCQQCQAGLYSAAASVCTPCAIGSYSAAGASVCIPAAAGYYTTGSWAAPTTTGTVVSSSYSSNGMPVAAYSFTSNGTIALNTAVIADILVVGGGGAGGGDIGGGGGGGGVYYVRSVVLAANTTYSINVGSGGLGTSLVNPSNINYGSNGYDSSFVGGETSYVAKGGGGGGCYSCAVTYQPGITGGSGGGGAGAYITSSTTPSLGGSTNQGSTCNAAAGGYAGGSGSYVATGGVTGPGLGGGYYAGGGGGGAGGPGGSYNANTGGIGGIGVLLNITGLPTYYAGGGGGGAISLINLKGGVGGLGGGGTGNDITGGSSPAIYSASYYSLPHDGTANTGGGGGGGGYYYSPVGNNNGGSGGSGIVVVALYAAAPCPAGSFSAAPGSSACSLCAAGTYSVASGSTSCVACPANSWSATGASVCSPSVGYYDLGKSLMAYYAFDTASPYADSAPGNPLGSGLTPSTTPPGVQTAGPWTIAGSPCCNSALFSQTSVNFGSNPSTSTNAQYFSVPINSLSAFPAQYTVCTWYYSNSISTGLFAGRNYDRIVDWVFLVLSRRYTSTDFAVAVSYPGWSEFSYAGKWEYDKWSHVCVKFDGTTTFSVYFNNIKSTSTTSGVSITKTPDSTIRYIGRSSAANDAPFLGAMDEFRIYNKALTDAEVSAIYAYSSNTTTSMMLVQCPGSCSAGQTKHCNAAGTAICCGAGQYYVDGSSATACSVCAAGTFAPDGGLTACTTCAAGTVSVAGAAACAGCPAGSTLQNGSCTAVAGYYDLGMSLMAYYTFDSDATLTTDNAINPLGGLTKSSTAPTSVVDPGTRTVNSATINTGKVAYLTNAGKQNSATDGQYFSLPSINFASTSFSVCAWYRPTGTVTSRNYDRVITIGNSAGGSNPNEYIYVSHAGAGTTDMVTSTNSYVATQSSKVLTNQYAVDTWGHFCSVVSGTNGNFYVNGVSNAYTLIQAMYIAVTANVNTMGKGPYGTDYLWAGYIDEVRLYPRALTQAEVSAIYAYSSNTTTAVMPLPCPVGTYSDANASACTTCQAGSFCLNGLQSPCAAGTFASTGSTACAACPVGSTSQAGSSVCTAVAGYYDLGRSLMAYYAFDASNMLADTSGKLGALTVSGKSPTTQADGAWAGGSAALFTQTGSTGLSSDTTNAQAFLLPSITLSTTAFTVCAWYMEGTGVSGRNGDKVFDFASGCPGGNIGIYHTSSGAINANWYNGATSVGGVTVSNAAFFTAGTWVHACSVADGTSFKLYLNGQSNSATGTGSISTASRSTSYIGKSTCTGDSLWVGAIDEVRLYPRALTQAEVSAIYAYSSNTTTAVMPVACPVGTYSDANASACSMCQAGSFCLNGIQSPCAANTFSAAGSTACGACPAGSSSLVGASACVALAGYYDLGKSLMAYYAFESADVLADSAPNPLGRLTLQNSGYPVTSITQTSAGTTGKSTNTGNVVSFSGNAGLKNGDSTAQALKLPSLTWPTSSNTICAWYQPGANIGSRIWEIVFDIGNGNGISDITYAHYDTQSYTAWGWTNGATGIGAGNAASNPGTYWTALQWNHVCLVTSTSTAYIYLNGAQYTTIALSATFASGIQLTSNWIGRNTATVANLNYFFGSMDEVRLYNKALTQAEVSAIYAYSSNTTTAVMPVACSLPGTYSDANASACTTCQAGFYCVNGLQSPCAANTFSAAGSTTCAACPAGSSSLVGASACVASAGYYDLGKSLMAYYAFDASNMLADSSGNLRTLTTSATAPTTQSSGPWSSGTCCSSAVFVASSSQYFTMPDLTLASASFSVCSWYKPTTTTLMWERWITMKAGSTTQEISLAHSNTDNFIQGAFGRSTGGGSVNGPSNSFVAGQWGHACYTLTGSTAVLYYNGVPYTTNGNMATTVPTTMSPNYIGQDTGGTFFFNGAVDEVRLYPRALTQAEVSAIYAYSSNTTTAVMPVACPAGTYSTGNTSSCTTCAPGTYSSPGSSACSLCAAGTGLPAMYFPFEVDTGNYGATAGTTSQYTVSGTSISMASNVCDVTTGANCKNSVYFYNPSSTNSLGSYLLATTPNTPQPITISAWANVAASYGGDLFSLLQSASGATSSQNAAINFDVGSTSSPFVQPAIALPTKWTGQTSKVGTSLPASKWFHTAVTVDSQFNVILYINGVSAATATGTGGFQPGWYSNLLIGGSAESARGYHGYIKDLRMYQYALNASTIAAIYSATSPCTACPFGSWSSNGGCSTCTAGYACANGLRTICAAGTFATSGSSVCSSCPANTNSAAGFSICVPNVGYYYGVNIVPQALTSVAGSLASNVLTVNGVTFQATSSTAISVTYPANCGTCFAANAFDLNTGTSWSSADWRYPNANGCITGCTTASAQGNCAWTNNVDSTGTIISGEWLDLAMNTPITITGYQFTTGPATSWRIVGSNDGGSTWTTVHYAPATTTKGYFPVSAQYAKYRFIGQCAADWTMYIAELIFFGTNVAACSNTCTGATAHCSASGTTVCCGAGTTYVDGLTTATTCTTCPAGSYSPNGTACSTCPANTYSAAGASACTPCAQGKISLAGSSTCVYYSGSTPLNSILTQAFTYSGAVQQWVVPAGVTSVDVKMWGAGGGGASHNAAGPQNGGSGGYSYGTIPVSAGSYMYVVVGGGGTGPQSSSVRTSGGFPNGGTSFRTAGAGGGRSQISLFNASQASASAAIVVAGNIMMIAAGGGGGALTGTTSGATGAQGKGGGGLSGNELAPFNKGGTQAALSGCSSSASGCTNMVYGSFLLGGSSDLNELIPGGGDGYYGGSCGQFSWQTIVAGGAGGSSYLSPLLSNSGTNAGGDNRAPPYNASDAINGNAYGLGGASGSTQDTCPTACTGQPGLVHLTYGLACPYNTYFANNSCLSCANVTNAACQGCLAGTFVNGATCSPCAAGSWSSAGATTCSSCTAGTYANASGASVCTQCAFGTFSSDGSSSCSNCTNLGANGAYTGPGTNSTNCPFVCAVGYYLTNGSCLPCANTDPNGLFVGPGTNSTNCPLSCAASYYSFASSCVACSIGKWSAAGQTACLACTNSIPANAIYVSSGTVATNCQWSCSVGYIPYNGSCSSCTSGAPAH